jgi:hypothetical protein
MINLTVGLLNWRRPDNLNKILDFLYGKVKIFLWDNSGVWPKDSRIDWQITSSINSKCPPRWWMLQQAQTDFVCSLDDDLIFKDIEIFNELIKLLDNNSDCIAVGGFGKKIHKYLPYKNWGWITNVDEDTAVDFLLGRFIFTKQKNLKNIIIDDLEDDIQLCATLEKKYNQKLIVPHLLKDQILELPDDFALWKQPNHFQNRQNAVDKYWFIDYRHQIKSVLPEDIVGCELGVFEGDFSKVLIDTKKFKKLYLVDTFSGVIHGTKEKIYQDGSILFDHVKQRFINNENIHVVKQDSVGFLNSLEDNTLDFVYIDTVHTYEQCIQELNAARRVVKNNGLICGHDYMRERFPGVCQAVEEFTTNYGIRFRLTQKEVYQSFFIVNHKE